MTTAEKMKAWADSLKPGDKVVIKLFGQRGCIDVATVKYFTPTGRVVTDKGTYFQSKYSGNYKGYGEAIGCIVPATPESIAEAERNKAKEEQDKKDREAIRTAGTIAWKIWRDEINLSADMARELIALHKKWEAEKHDND